MKIIQSLKAWFAAKKALANIKETSVKSGWKTTEFWITCATNAITVVGALKGLIPENTAAIVLAIANSVYTVARAFTKATATTEPDASKV